MGQFSQMLLEGGVIFDNQKWIWIPLILESVRHPRGLHYGSIVLSETNQ